MAENNGERSNGRKEPRPAKDIKGLLRFCMEVTKGEDAPGSSETMEPMTEERKKWLEEALTSMTVSPVERLRACLALIEEAEINTEAGTDQQIQALTELEDWMEDLNIAVDFVKIKGLRIVPGLLSSEVSELRWRCLELLANLAQNNPVGQRALLDLQLLPVMVALLDSDPNPTVRTKALYAISCLVRNNEQAQQHLLSGDGLTAIIKSLETGNDKLRTKATFLISSLTNSNPAFRDCLIDQGVVEHVVRLLREEEHSGIHEHFMSALLALVSGSSTAQKKCLEPSLDLRTFLCQRAQALEGKEEFQEEREHANQILNVLNSGATPQGSSDTNRTSALMLA